jgi:hypothetical protein
MSDQADSSWSVQNVFTVDDAHPDSTSFDGSLRNERLNAVSGMETGLVAVAARWAASANTARIVAAHTARQIISVVAITPSSPSCLVSRRA